LGEQPFGFFIDRSSKNGVFSGNDANWLSFFHGYQQSSPQLVDNFVDANSRNENRYSADFHNGEDIGKRKKFPHFENNRLQEAYRMV